MKRLTTVLVAALTGLACQNSGPLTPSPAAGSGAAELGRGVVISTTGGGMYNAGVIVEFSMSALGKADGSARGEFHHKTVLGGLAVDFSGRVTCVAVDSVNRRAWIGGVVTANRSEHPSFTGDINQIGRDVWFRVLDTGEGQTDPDRTTFLGFEGAAGIITSAEYCEAQIWPNDPPNDRTSPLTAGDIQVRP
jgi:hypothetical protein